MKKEKITKFAIAMLGMGALFFLDRLSKAWAEVHLRGNGPIVLIKGALEFNYTQNTGIAFGLFQGLGVVFIILTVILAVILVLLLWKLPAKRHFLPLNVIFTMILAGALGNLWDRLFQSYVTDFIYIRLINFPIFNVADIYVSLGIIVLLFYLLFFYKDEELKALFSFRKAKEEKEPEITEETREEGTKNGSVYGSKRKRQEDALTLSCLPVLKNGAGLSSRSLLRMGASR